MRNRVRGMVLVAGVSAAASCASICFGQAGSPDQAAFNRAVMTYRETVEAELAKVTGAVAAADGENAGGNPIRKNLVSSEVARKSAIAVAGSAAAVQARASRFAAEEWVAVVDRVGDVEPLKASAPEARFPARYWINLTWCPNSDSDFTTALKAVEAPGGPGPVHQKLTDDFNLVRATLWIDDSNNELLKAAAAVNPGDTVLFMVDTAQTHELHLTRMRETSTIKDVETKLFEAANLDRKQMLGWLPDAVSIDLAKRRLALFTPPWKLEVQKIATSPPPAWDGLHLKSIRVIDLETAKRRSVTVCALAGVIEQQLFADRVRSATAAASITGVEPWLSALTDTPERLLYESQARVFEDRGVPERTALTLEAAKKGADTSLDTFKAEALINKALAEVRAGKAANALATIKEVAKAKPSEDEAILANAVQCLAHLATNQKEQAVKEGRDILEKVNADPGLPDYRILALLAEIQATTGIEGNAAGKGADARPGAMNSIGKAKFFDIEAKGTRFAYIVDISGSMDGARIAKLKEELVKSVNNLPDTSSFMISVFSTDATSLGNKRDWTKANDSGKKWARGEVHRLSAAGGTNPANAFKMAFELKPLPDAIFFLTDGEIPENEGEALLSLNKDHHIPVYCACLESNEGEQMLKRIAKESGATYTFIPGVSKRSR